MKIRTLLSALFLTTRFIVSSVAMEKEDLDKTQKPINQPSQNIDDLWKSILTIREAELTIRNAERAMKNAERTIRLAKYDCEQNELKITTSFNGLGLHEQAHQLDSILKMIDENQAANSSFMESGCIREKYGVYEILAVKKLYELAGKDNLSAEQEELFRSTLRFSNGLYWNLTYDFLLKVRIRTKQLFPKYMLNYPELNFKGKWDDRESSAKKKYGIMHPTLSFPEREKLEKMLDANPWSPSKNPLKNQEGRYLIKMDDDN